MEITGLKNGLSNLVLKEPLPFSKKRDINWKAIRVVSIAGVIAAVIIVLLLPAPKPVQKTFYEKSDGRGGIVTSSNAENNPTEDALSQLQSGRRSNSMVGAIDSSGGAPAQGSASQNRNSTMVLTRGGIDSKTQLPPGGRISLTLDQSITLDSHSMPVIATVSHDVIQENGVAIPQGAKLFGDASFDDGSERVQINWKTVQFPNGSMRPISGIGVGQDGQVGVEGDVHSEALKNTVGQTLSRFIGAYAEGSMQRGAFGGNPGGEDNGMKNAIAETAKDRANGFAENMKKEKKWVVLQMGVSFFAVVTQPFLFRDPGATYGR